MTRPFEKLVNARKHTQERLKKSAPVTLDQLRALKSKSAPVRRRRKVDPDPRQGSLF